MLGGARENSCAMDLAKQLDTCTKYTCPIRDVVLCHVPNGRRVSKTHVAHRSIFIKKKIIL
jgi:hypothetical protein